MIRCRPLRPEDYPAVRQIIAEAFPQQAADNPRALALYTEEPWYDPEHLLVAEAEGRVVAQLGVRDGSLWCSGVPLPSGLVGTVCTAAPWRGRGIGAQLMRCAFGWMEEGGLAVSLLHTSEERHGFYGRLGYCRAVMEQPRLILPMPDLHVPPAPLALRPARVDEAAALDALYAATYGRASGAWSRTVPFWRRRLQGVPKLWSRPLAFRVAGQGPPLAYAAVEETAQAAVLHELACLPGAEDLAAALLRALLAGWRQTGVTVAEASLSSTHPLRSLVDALGAEDRTGYGVVFIRVQQADAFARAAKDLLEGRARQAGVRLEVDVTGEAAAPLSPAKAPAEGWRVLQLGAGPPLRLQLSPGDLASLLYNGRRLAGLRVEGRCRADPDDPALLGQLFPDTGASRCSLDAY
ncbi:MAG: GNAT family N-acetyltransferase [Candidatus Latescibacterota bacterium]